MPRRRRQPPTPRIHIRLFWSTIALIKRNPWKALVGAVVFFGGTPTAVGGYNMTLAWVDPVVPAFHYWVRREIEPIIKVQSTQSLSIDRFLLYRQQEDLAKIQAEPEAKTSPTVQDKIKNLQDQINDTSCRIRKAEGKNCK